MKPASIIVVAATVMLPSIALAQAETSADVPTSRIIERNKSVVAKFYPPSSVKRGEEGTVQFKILINREGRLDGCQVTNSSGYAALDKATCDMMLSGATGQVRRATDNRRVVYTREGLVEWTLPDSAVKPATPPPFDVARSSSGEPLICRRQTKSGSNFITEKVCLTRADWNRQEGYAQEETQRMQRPQGNSQPFP